MPIVSFVSPKGGVGKTTAALVLAGELAEVGEKVILIDADPNHPLQDWYGLSETVDNISVISDITEDNIIDVVDDAHKKAKFVVVDLEGTGSAMVGYAISRSDLVIIPLQGSQLDAKQAVKAIQLIRRNEKAFDRKIKHALLFSKTNVAIQPKTYRHVLAEFTAADVDILESQLLEREAFRTMFSYGGTLYDQSSKNVSNLGAAKDNSSALAFDIIQRLPLKKSKRKLAS